MKEAALADKIRRRILGESNKPSSRGECKMCGRGCRDTQHFCSDRCEQYHATGFPVPDPNYSRKLLDAPLGSWTVVAGPPDLPVGVSYYNHILGRPIAVAKQPTKTAYMIRCASCQSGFESRDLRCCSAVCERRCREREDSRKMLAAAGIEPAPKRVCEHCGTTIPKWRGGRLVSSATRFCSNSCSRKAKKTAA